MHIPLYIGRGRERIHTLVTSEPWLAMIYINADVKFISHFIVMIRISMLLATLHVCVYIYVQGRLAESYFRRAVGGPYV